MTMAQADDRRAFTQTFRFSIWEVGIIVGLVGAVMNFGPRNRWDYLSGIGFGFAFGVSSLVNGWIERREKAE
jgi:hypothetical protein